MLKPLLMLLKREKEVSLQYNKLLNTKGISEIVVL
jgi:hypothetical protein